MTFRRGSLPFRQATTKCPASLSEVLAAVTANDQGNPNQSTAMLRLRPLIRCIALNTRFLFNELPNFNRMTINS